MTSLPQAGWILGHTGALLGHSIQGQPDVGTLLEDVGQARQLASTDQHWLEPEEGWFADEAK